MINHKLIKYIDIMIENYIKVDDVPRKNEYVCWLDLMGTKSLMKRSPTTCTINICQLHVCLSSFKSENVRLYPVMDGAFITTKSKTDLKNFLRNVFSSMSNDFIEGKNHLYQSIIRASIAFGPLIHGIDIESDKISKEYKNSLLFGLPMTQAYSSENKAPPFGIYIDKSARTFATPDEKPFTTRWYIWFDPKYDSGRLIKAINKFYDWAEKMSFCLPLNEDTILLHKKKSEQYLNYYKNNPTQKNF